MKYFLLIVFLVFVSCRQTINSKFVPPKLPSSLSFAGESVPLDDWDVKERLDRELTINQNYHSSTMLIYKQLGRNKKYIESILKENDVPEDFFFLAVAESSLNPQSNSSAGAAGVWQFIQSTASMYGLEVNDSVDERRHLKKSTEAACKYFKEAKKEFGTWTMAAAAYNRGIKGMKDAVSGQKESDYYKLYLNSETYRYVFRILALKLILSSPQDYNFRLENSDFYPEYKVKTVPVSESIQSLPEFAKTNGTNYKELIILNPWVRTGKYKFEATPGKTYEFAVPEK